MTSLISIARDSAGDLSKTKPESTLQDREDKAALRRALIDARRVLSSDMRTRLDSAIAALLVAWWQSNPVQSLGVFWPIQHEPDLRTAYALLAAKGVQLALPIVDKRDAPLRYAAWTPGDPVVKDALGISIPAKNEVSMLPEALLIPCVGFNQARFRLGYGGGFYDRTLDTSPRPLAVGIAYAASSATFSAAPHDIPMDVLITETQIVTSG
jgi:5,10-methenyltetrahydrofolate synthetase